MGHADPFLGKVVTGEQGRYRLEEVVGKGSMARVYRGRDLERDAPCAVKVLRERRMDAELQARFKQEALLGQTFRHAHAVAVRDHGLHEGRPFLVMDLVEGRPLDELMRERGRYEPAEAATLVATVARTLADAHAKGILHRDVKPSNVLVSKAGKVLLMDFGLAKDTTNQDLHLTYQGELLGTPSYMSPEQARGQPADARSDVHALGVILYELLTARLPYPSDSVDETLRLLRESTPPAPRSLEPSIPRELEAIVLRAMARDPAERTPSCARLAEELAVWLTGPAPRAGVLRPVALVLGLIVLGLGAGWGIHAALQPGVEAPDDPAPTTGPAPPAHAPLDPAAARREALERRLAEHPEDGGTWLELARLQLQRGDVEGAAASLDTVVERGDAAAVKQVPELRVELDATRSALTRVYEAAQAERRGFDAGAALRRVQQELLRQPDAALLRSAEGVLLADHGQWRAAVAALEAATALDPTAGPTRETFEAIRERAVGAKPGAPPGAPLWASWEPFLGGAWREVSPGVVAGSEPGLGMYSLCGLISRQERTRGDHYRLRVQLRLLSGQPGCYGGLILGARESEDFLAVYVFHDEHDARRHFKASELERLRRQSGAWPKFVRVGRVRQGEWSHVATQVTHFPDEGQVALEAVVEGQSLHVLVNGSPALETSLPFAPAGRVGLIKYYDSAIEAQGFELVQLD